jgi:pyruvate/2-oxoglutarate dehydrogenase complex dihydrolipoamide acyltransferase (E2) component
VAGGQVVPMPAVTLRLAADHRIGDGHVEARFHADIMARVQHPQEL